MVQLSLTTIKGNAGTRHFPFQGYLGLTPIRVEGIARTRFDEDLKPVLAKSLTVSIRAYESRQTRMGGVHTRLLADYSHTLWKKPDGQSYAEIGEFESTFKITLPKRVAGFSTANYQDYRTYWKIEAGMFPTPSRCSYCALTRTCGPPARPCAHLSHLNLPIPPVMRSARFCPAHCTHV